MVLGLSRIFNKTVKISYSCMPNVEKQIKKSKDVTSEIPPNVLLKEIARLEMSYIRQCLRVDTVEVIFYI